MAPSASRVELWDETGATHNTFKTGSPFEVRIHFHARVPVQRPVFGLAVYHENGAHVSGPNTRFGGLEIPAVEGSGVVTYRIDELPLLEGRYRLSVAAVDAVSDEVYDYQDRLFQFHVYPDTLAERYGLVTLGGAWSLD
ncbi:MAG: Wzt carbohydrate-binding domain-containing protein [Anaerolineales bacterium]|nr:Wzt carbohydrate-binding domain-containing protein [Anaerolineales bacterium]